MKQAPVPKRLELFFLQLVIIGAISYSVYFLLWFFDKDIIDNTLMFSLISVTIVYRFFRLFHQWFHLFFLKVIQNKESISKKYSVDVFTTFCPGEPYDMVEETLKAIKSIGYPHGTYLCCEGDDERLEEFCKDQGIKFISRYERIDAKAGNINNALKSSKAEICVILDPDHKPSPEFIDVVLPYFDDQKVGFVQVPQIYYNQDASFVAKGAAQQTYEFYGPLMQATNSFGTTQAIGANCTFRREALDSIDGHAPGLTEDMHTSMLLHNKHWKSVFVPSVVSEGQVPLNLSSYFKQQLKWSRGSFDLLFKVYPKIFKNISFSQKLHYLTIPLYFLFGLFLLLDYTVPIYSLFSGNYPLKCRMDDLLVMLMPLLCFAIFIKMYAQKWYYARHEKGVHLYGEVLRLSTWWINLLGLLYTIIGKNVPYFPTPKEDIPLNELKISLPNIVTISVMISAIIFGLNNDWSDSTFLMSGYLLIYALFLTIGVFFGLGKIYKNVAISKSLKFFGTLNFQFWKKLAFINIILSFIVFGYYFNNYRDKPDRLIDAKSSNYKETGGYFLASPDESSNTNYLTINSLEEWKDVKILDDNKYTYLNFRFNISDSTKLVKTLDSIFDLNGSLFLRNLFVDLVKINDSLNPFELNNLFKIQYDFMLSRGVKPAFVFSFKNRHDLNRCLPDAKYFDWLNYHYNDSLVEYKDIYYKLDQLNQDFVIYKKPVFISTSKKSENWYSTFSEAVKNDYKEIKGLITSDNVNFNLEKAEHYEFKNLIKTYEYRRIEDFKGVYYNVGQDWKDDIQKLTRKGIEKDIGRIKKMGANTILRYGPTKGDRNILKVCEAAEINIFYGFSFSTINNFNRNENLLTIENEAINFVKLNRKNKSITAWNLGGDVLTKLNKLYSEPELSMQRKGCLNFINSLAQGIKEIDDKPVTIHIPLDARTEYFAQLIKNNTPDVDLIGLGIHYLSDSTYLESEIVRVFREEKRVYLSSFGIDDYSDNSRKNRVEYRDLDNTIIANELAENEDMLKKEQLLINIYKLTKYDLLGGFYNSWTDKMDGTFTWSGLTDYRSLLKPNYYALQKNWNKDFEEVNYPEISIKHDYPYFEEDSTYEFTIQIDGNNNFTNTKWMLCKNDILPLNDAIILEENNKVIIQLPNDVDNMTTYRLYAFVSDGKNVTTSSYFLPLKWYYYKK